MTTIPIEVRTALAQVTVFQTAALTPVNTDEADNDHQPVAMCRQGKASYGDFNLGLHVGDTPASVLDNRMRLLATINRHIAPQSTVASQPLTRLHWVDQVHGNQVHDVDIKREDTSAFSMRPTAADAMVSTQVGVGLAIMTADCVPIVLYQAKTGRIAAIHAGWQGLACGVIAQTAAHFEADAPITAWVGVCISQDNYEVGQEVGTKLLAGCRNHQLLPNAYLDTFDTRYAVPSEMTTQTPYLHNTVDKLSNNATVSTDKIKLDLPKLAVDQLTAAGITVCTDRPQPCSYADTHYYSYRRQTHRQQPATGRMALVIVRHS